MAVGDVINGMFTLAAGATVTIRPASGVEWCLHGYTWNTVSGTLPNLGWAIADSVSNVCQFQTTTAEGANTGISMHLKNAQYLRVNNGSAGTAMMITYEGVVTK